jgi:hypothetical protein
VRFMDEGQTVGTEQALNQEGRGARMRHTLKWSWVVVAVLGAGCGLVPAPKPPPAPVPPPPARPPVTAPPATPAPPAAAPAARARNWHEYREQAARRMVQVNPAGTYTGTPPDPLMAIPVLEVELLADGSVASVRVERVPREAKETVQMAIDAVRRAGPYGPVGHLPKPWRFTEVFLFDYQFRFKPRSLD